MTQYKNGFEPLDLNSYTLYVGSSFSKEGFNYKGYQKAAGFAFRAIKGLDSFHFNSHKKLMAIASAYAVKTGLKVNEISLNLNDFKTDLTRSEAFIALRDKLNQVYNFKGLKVLGWYVQGMVITVTVAFSLCCIDALNVTIPNNTSAATIKAVINNEPIIDSIKIPTRVCKTVASIVKSDRMVIVKRTINKIINTLPVLFPKPIETDNLVKVGNRLITEDKVQLGSSESFYPIPYDDGPQRSMGFGSAADPELCHMIWKRAGMWNGPQVAKQLHTAGYKKSLKIIASYKNRKGVLSLKEAEDLRDKEWSKFKTFVDENYTFLSENRRKVLANVSYNIGMAGLRGYHKRIPESKLSVYIRTQDFDHPNNFKEFKKIFINTRITINGEYSLGLARRREKEFNAFMATTNSYCALAHAKDLIDDIQNYSKFMKA